MKARHFYILLLVLTLFGCGVSIVETLDHRYGLPEVQQRVDGSIKADKYADEIRPILDNRCVVCHACYDAPCQLKLSSIEGIDRGASAQEVYEGTRLLAIEPSRLYIDAKDTEGWRNKGFWPVLNERRQNLSTNLEASLLYQLLLMKENNPAPDASILPESFDFRRDRNQVCPNLEALDAFKESHPLWGMPYGLPPLNDEELSNIRDWIATGAIVAPRAALPPREQRAIKRWETFLNQDSKKAKLMSRYLYEHLFLAHLYFDEGGSGEFFKLVRSKTPPGEEIHIIATRRPYEDPQTETFYYRLWRERSSISEKTHMPYRLDAARMKRWKALFLEPDYSVKELPSYDSKQASNPFRTFKDIPVHSRYSFLLDEAQFTIMGFIKGPVCRGQTALNVIEDRFWVVFLNPDLPQLAHEDEFYAEAQGFLELPSAKGSNTSAIAPLVEYSIRHRRFLEAKREYVKKTFKDLDKQSVELIWDGEQRNKNASLTVFRNFDSATVVRGLVGDTPKTAWLISYGILERLHYLLVAGFDVFGNVGHQLNSRLYMDFLRMEGESNFLHLLPPEHRREEMNFWYRDAESQVEKYLVWSEEEEKLHTGIPFQTDEPKKELFALLRTHFAGALDSQFALSNAPQFHASLLSQVSGTTSSGYQHFPETAFLRVRGPGGDLVFTILRDTGLKNVSSPFFESDRRVPAEDELTIAYGILGAYPNSFFDMEQKQLAAFVRDLLSLKTDADYRRLLTNYGVRRNDPAFWEFSDWLHRAFKKQSRIESGLLDYNRFENR